MNNDNLRVQVVVGVEDEYSRSTPAMFKVFEVNGSKRKHISTTIRTFSRVCDPEAFTEWERRTCNECIDAVIAARTLRMGTRTHP